MDFDNRKVYGDTSITDGLVLFDPIQELVYFVTQCAFVELDHLLFGVPFKNYIAEFFLMW